MMACRSQCEALGLGVCCCCRYQPWPWALPVLWAGSADVGQLDLCYHHHHHHHQRLASGTLD